MKTGIFLLLMIIGLFCAAGTARIDLISGNAGLPERVKKEIAKTIKRLE